MGVEVKRTGNRRREETHQEGPLLPLQGHLREPLEKRAQIAGPCSRLEAAQICEGSVLLLNSSTQRDAPPSSVIAPVAMTNACTGGGPPATAAGSARLLPHLP